MHGSLAVRFGATALTAALLTLAVCGCGGPAASDHDHRPGSAAQANYSGPYPIQIVCTTGQVAELVRKIGGKHVAVTAMMGPGVDPHSYKHPPSETARLQQADAVVYNGLHLEGRLGETIRQLSQRVNTFAVTDELVAKHDPRLRQAPEFEGSFDPHVWHDAKLWATCARFVARRLAEFDPQHRGDFESHLKALESELDEVEAACHAAIAKIPAERRVLITAHDAFGYFGTAYGLEVYGLQGLSTTDEVDLGRMDELVNLIIDRNIASVFVESAVAPRTIEALIEPCRERGHQVQIAESVLYADALGEAGSPAETYAGMMRHNAHTIAAALNPEGSPSPPSTN